MLTVDAGDDAAFFSKLPVEVKENIYEHVLRYGGFFQVPLRIDIAHELVKLPSVCRTNKLERSISTLVLARNTVLRLSGLSDYALLLQWLKAVRIPEDRFMQAVKKIQIIYRNRDSFIQNLSFAARFPVLTNLTITVSAWKLVEISQEYDEVNEDRYGNSYVNANPAGRCHMKEYFGLKQIDGCKALSSLTLHKLGHINWSAFGLFYFGVSDVHHVAEVCQKSFMEANGRHLTVEMAYSYFCGKPRSKVGKDREQYSDWTGMDADLEREGDMALQYGLYES
jgi:hypothetical protein